MSYTKQTWATGDTVTATKLNHMEDGIEGAGGGGGYDAVFVITTFEDDPPILNVVSGTYADFSSKYSNGDRPTAQVFLEMDGEEGYNPCFVPYIIDGGEDNIVITAMTMTGGTGSFFGDSLNCFGFQIVWDANGTEIQL